MNRIFIFFLLLILFISVASGQEEAKKQYHATEITTPPVIDGILNEDIWKTGTWIDDFTQNEPYNGKPATQRTEFNILFDENNLYVAIRAYDTSPDSIVNRLTRRDEADGDLVGIILDSYHDLRTAFLFGVSSAGVKFDQIFTNDGQNEDSSWDPNWWVATSVNEEGWVAEMKIPFSQVRFEKNSGDVWGLEMARIIYRNNETTFWQHIPKDAPGLVHLFGEMTGLEKIKPRKIFDVTPYGVARAETFDSESYPENSIFTKDRKFGKSVGIDAKIGVTNNMTMDLTINPDFGQVEADPSEVNLTAYETFFREKRPFFIEGSNIMSFGLGLGDGDVGNDNLFYSRRIGKRPQGYPDLEDGWKADIPAFTSILGAAKLTGKTQKGLSVGFMEAVTQKEVAEIDTIGGSHIFDTVEPMTNYFVGRVQKDFDEGNTIIGGIFTSTNRNLNDNLASFMHKGAYSWGIDFTQYFKDKTWMLNLSTAFSEVNGTKEAIEQTQESSARYFQRPDNDYVNFDPNRTSLFGSAGRVQIIKAGGHFNYGTLVNWKTPGFEVNDIGYIRDADQIIGVFFASYNQWDPKWIYRRYNINFDVFSFFNFGGDRLGTGMDGNANMGFKNFWNAWTSFNMLFNNLSPGMLRGGPMMMLPGNISYRAGFSTDERKKISFNFSANNNTGFEKSSESLYTEAGVSFKPTNYLRFSIGPGFSKSFDELQYVTRTNYGQDDRYVFASIDRYTVSASIRVNLNLSPDLTLQYWGQPFVATGRYSDYKYITDPMADKYRDRFHVYTPSQISSDPDNYYIDENGDGTNDYYFGKSDFNFQQFLSNLVIRWEYSPGSSLYLVWNQTRTGFNSTGNMDLFNDVGNLFDSKENKPHNIFLIKLSYRFGIK
jgi:hypothetical protein